MKLVVDASIAVKWFLRELPDEQHLDRAEALARVIERPETELLAPDHWMMEIVAVLARLRPVLVDDALVALHDMSPNVISGAAVLKRAADMSVALNHHLFDTLYHAVALEEGATLVTADATYFAKARDLGAIIPLAEFAL